MSAGTWLATNGTAIHKWFTLGLVFGAVGYAVSRSTSDPKGMLRRFATTYVARIDAEQRSMFQKPTGLSMGWLQLALLGGLVTLYGVVPAWPLLVGAVAVALGPPIAVRVQVARRRARIDDQAHGFALALANSLKATASIGDALRGATDVTSAPLQPELRMVLQQVGIGSSLEEALLALSTRVQSPALDVVVSALLIGRQTGGDLPRILEGVAASLRDLKRLEQLTDKVSRGAKMSLAISASITIGIALLLPQMFPGFLDPLRDTVKGQLYAAQMVVVYVAGLYLGYRFTRKSI